MQFVLDDGPALAGAFLETASFDDETLLQSNETDDFRALTVTADPATPKGIHHVDVVFTMQLDADCTGVGKCDLQSGFDFDDAFDIDVE